MKENVNLIVATVIINVEPTNKQAQLYNSLWSPACNLILCILCLKQYLPCQCIHKSSFLEQIMGNGPELINFET